MGELALIDPKTGQDRHWPVESRAELAEAVERRPEIAEWCRKDDENLEALLQVAKEMEPGLGEALERLFREGGDAGAEAFAGAVRRVLAEGAGAGEGIAEEWRKAREAKAEERRKAEEEERRRREEQARLLKTPGRVMTLTLPGGAEMEMAWCPAGSFLMGSQEDEEKRSGDETQHEVTLTKGFWMARTPVTQKQWKSVMGNNPSGWKGDDLPVENVDWNDCQAFCEKAGLRLPTEAEWEYACRAGSTGPYAGNGRLEDMGWFGGNSGGKTHPVGQKRANAWGFYDMHGNVWEWCADSYQDDLGRAAVTNPTGAGSGFVRVLRGGGCRYGASSCRSAVRRRGDPGYGDDDRGFRPVARQD